MHINIYVPTERQRRKARWKERDGERQSERDIHEIYVDIKIKLKHSKSVKTSQQPVTDFVVDFFKCLPSCLLAGYIGYVYAYACPCLCVCMSV